jgi:hypothetical protein
MTDVSTTGQDTGRPSDLVRDELPDLDAVPGTSAPTMEDLTEALKDVVDPSSASTSWTWV